MRFEFAARTHVGCVRRLNEDALLCRPDLGLWAVADGMGGHDCGDVASALVMDSLTGHRPGEDPATRVPALRAALQDANDRLVEMGRSGPVPRTIGATVVLLATEAGTFSCLWAGDSRAYLARDGVLSQLTKDHSLVQELVDAGVLEAADAASHPNANVIRRAVGAEETLEIDDVEGQILPADVFLLASDGLTRVLSKDDLLAGLQDEDLEAAADRFVAACLDRGAPDNLTLVLVRIAP